MSVLKELYIEYSHQQVCNIQVCRRPHKPKFVVDEWKQSLDLLVQKTKRKQK